MSISAFVTKHELVDGRRRIWVHVYDPDSGHQIDVEHVFTDDEEALIKNDPKQLIAIAQQVAVVEICYGRETTKKAAQAVIAEMPAIMLDEDVIEAAVVDAEKGKP